MNCEQIQNELFDYLGQAVLPTHLARHLEDCPSCQQLWDELHTLSEHIGNDGLFYPAEHEVAQLAAQIDSAISSKEQLQPRSWRTLLNYLVPIAAALLILLGIARIGSKIQTWDETQPTENILYTLSGEASADELDEGTISLLLEDFSSYDEISSSELLLDDLSDEEMEYLVKNMDIGELL